MILLGDTRQHIPFRWTKYLNSIIDLRQLPTRVALGFIKLNMRAKAKALSIKLNRITNQAS
jgi:hypothetical protein